MAYTSYITIDGMLIGEETNGVMRNYGTDALGSVVTTSLNGVPENTYRYKPYGGLLAKTGAAPDPSFLWNGGSGYRATSLPVASAYVRRRHYAATVGAWSTVDREWPRQPPYAYCLGGPVTDLDPTGRTPARQFVSMSCHCANTQTKAGIYDTQNRAGFVVQQVTFTMSLTDCAGTPYTGLPCQTGTPYYELFPLAGAPGKGAPDNWDFNDKNALGSCFIGTVSWQGVLWYTATQPPGFGGKNQVPCSSQSLSTYTMPPGFTAEETASATVTFGCCSNLPPYAICIPGDICFPIHSPACCHKPNYINNCSCASGSTSAAQGTARSCSGC